jgi:hypothetical protein
LIPKLAENPGSIANEYFDFQNAIIGNSPKLQALEEFS